MRGEVSSCFRRMAILPQDVDIDILRSLHFSINSWLPKRLKTIKAIEEAALRMKSARVDGSELKLMGSGMGFVSSATAGVLGLVSIFATGGLAAPLIAAGGLAGVVGIGGAVVSIGGEITKAVNMPSLSSMQDQWKDESDAYHTVIEVVKNLNQHITEKGIPDQYYDSIILAVRKVCQIVVSMYSISSFANDYMAEIASAAASGAAVEFLEASVKEATPEVLQEVAKEAAEEAVRGSQFVSKLSMNPKLISEAVGKTAGKVVFKEAAKGSSKAGVVESAKHASASMGRKVGREMLRESVEEVAEVAGSTAGSAGSFVGKIIGRSLPFVNFAFAGWEAYEIYKAHKTLSNGTEDEKRFRRQVTVFKEETNRIVRDIYNPLAAAQQPPLPSIPVPFP